MSDNEPSVEEQQVTAPPRRLSRKYPWAIVAVVVLFVIVPFISWYGTWFGRPLSDAKMEEYLHDKNKPRNVQHALAQIGNRIVDGDKLVQRFYPEVVLAADNPQPEVRMTAAWSMGQDNTSQEFHDALMRLVKDTNRGVRHNAALALVQFADSSGRPELVDMLEPITLRCEHAGKVELIVKEGSTAVAPNAPLARITEDGGNVTTLQAPEAGRITGIAVTDGARVEGGGELMTLQPSTEQVWEALRALYLVGQPE